MRTWVRSLRSRINPGFLLVLVHNLRSYADSGPVATLPLISRVILRVPPEEMLKIPIYYVYLYWILYQFIQFYRFYTVSISHLDLYFRDLMRRIILNLKSQVLFKFILYLMFILCLFNPLYYTYWDIYISDLSLGCFVKIYYMVYFNIVYC